MDGYYIQLFSPHGLIRFSNPEIGRDKDTGGQVKYVLELLEHLSMHPLVRKVDLFTRRIEDNRVSTSYEKEIETVNENARIVRISCGGHTYRQKETLWDYLDEFVDKTIRFIDEEADFPDVVHGHYADGNYLASQIAEIFGIPCLATGHSLGRNKKNLLLQEGMSPEKIDDTFNMDRRIAVEESMLKTADLFVVSTQHIINSQYASYNGCCGDQHSNKPLAWYTFKKYASPGYSFNSRSMLPVDATNNFSFPDNIPLNDCVFQLVFATSRKILPAIR